MSEQTPNSIRKAIIPAAGFGTRMFPATKAIKKEFFPIVDREGRVKPVILEIVEEAISAGIEEIGIIVQEGDRSLFEDFFHKPPYPTLEAKLKPQNQDYNRYLLEIGQKVTLIPQDRADGLGYAVYCAKKWANNEPFLLLLGDHIYTSFIDKNCVSQLLSVYQHIGRSTIGMRVSPAHEIHHYGCITGQWQAMDAVLSISEIYEKPTIEYAQQHLRVRGMGHNEFLSVFGLYVLTPAIFDCLEQNIRQNQRENNEFQLTSCLEQVRQIEGMMGYLVKGRCFDVGLPDVYRQTMIDFRQI
ncbi:MAG: sugar phosphate nucleotidyltransferase [Jaaginema sp. PMC 1079.18]|nr:sugar phosphate nucleotidyltransferase [Jaaginema sp. PMC 1080.18]MEC4851727.1 sugar phosphate nucleotidyltransferase [Jaaginema sp. PMC 1079.18]MEC4865802.1 sugar phosphate nucleotidyltransferase [Jaaginema sp. PMC 1078.18]